MNWQKWQIDHPFLSGLIVVAESAAVGAALDVTANGVDFTKDGIKHAATIVVTAVVVAMRNYLKTNAADLKKLAEKE
jgi:hypothetical protein